MKKILIIVAVVLVLGGVGFFFFYNSYLRFTDSFTDCPVVAFKAAASSPESAMSFVTEDALGSLSITERCSVDCEHGNTTACVLYALAVNQGVHVMQSEKEAVRLLEKVCKTRLTLACQLKEAAERAAEEKAKAEAKAAVLESNKGALELIARSKGEATRLQMMAKRHFKGGMGPMGSSSMLNWYDGTIKYLLYKKPLLSQMHRIPGVKPGKGLGLKEFVEAKYLSGEGKPDIDQLKEFLDKVKRLGVMQIRLDYRVEKKKESEIKKGHGYFRAKHTFLYHAAGAELEILELAEKKLTEI